MLNMIRCHITKINHWQMNPVGEFCAADAEGETLHQGWCGGNSQASVPLGDAPLESIRTNGAPTGKASYLNRGAISQVPRTELKPQGFFCPFLFSA